MFRAESQQGCGSFATGLHVHAPKTTSPIISSGSSKDEVVEIIVEDGREALLAGSEHLVAPRPVLAEVPVAPVFGG